jgi:hypothetical protein
MSDVDGGVEKTFELGKLSNAAHRLSDLTAFPKPRLKAWHVAMNKEFDVLREILAVDFPQHQKRRLSAFRSITTGGVNAHELLARVESLQKERKFFLESSARYFLKGETFQPSPVSEKIDVVLLGPDDFDVPSSRWHFLNPGWLAEWSEGNLDRQVVELCQPEDAAHLLLEYDDQPECEQIQVATKSFYFGRPERSRKKITMVRTGPCLLNIGRNRGDPAGFKLPCFQYLETSWLNSLYGHKALFRLRNV